MVFRRKGGASASAGAPEVHPPSIIGADLNIVGDLDGHGELHIEGRVDGNVRANSLTVGEKGHIEGRVQVETLNVLGTIRGSVRAKFVFLFKTAVVIGDVSHERLEIQAGAVVDGFYKHAKAATIEKRPSHVQSERVPPRSVRKPLRKSPKPAPTPPVAAEGESRSQEDKTEPVH